MIIFAYLSLRIVPCQCSQLYQIALDLHFSFYHTRNLCLYVSLLVWQILWNMIDSIMCLFITKNCPLSVLKVLSNCSVLLFWFLPRLQFIIHYVSTTSDIIYNIACDVSWCIYFVLNVLLYAFTSQSLWIISFFNSLFVTWITVYLNKFKIVDQILNLSSILWLLS